MKRKLNKRSVALLVSLAVIFTAAVGVTLAYIFTNTDPVQNTFTPAQVSCAVVEKLDDTQQGNVSAGQVTGDSTDGIQIKSDVQIKNTGNTDAYIRVAVVITWKSADGTKVWAEKPVEDTDYSIDWAFDDDENPTDWFVGSDGYYYFKKSVSKEAMTDILINEAEQLKTAPETGYVLSIEIVASAIQANPADVVKDQWGVTVANDGTISK